MKKLLLAAFLFPFVVLAGGHASTVDCTQPTHEATLAPAPISTVYQPPTEGSVTVSPPTPTISVVPQQAPVVPQQGGGSQIWCSGPTAPGWRVDLPNGGCKPAETAQLTTISPKSIPHVIPVSMPKVAPIPVVYLKDVPYTGYAPTWWEYILDLLLLR